MSNYSKCKDRAPEDTIFEIQRLLNDAGIFTTLEWVRSAYSGICSNRVTIYPTDLGTNGKGTDRLYATASGYAELIERIQNNILCFRPVWMDSQRTAGFAAQPDEREMPIGELLDQNDPFFGVFWSRMGLISRDQQETFLENCAELYERRTDGKLLALPFTDMLNDRIVWLPYSIIREIYGSNGMAAGNTLEEALVQGISELFERYVNTMLLKGECVPPEIPDEELKPYSLWKLVEEIRAEGKYTIRALDCSLGRGLPVSAVVIGDMERGTFGVKLGSHPSFAVSMERTLTESFQGRQMTAAAGMCAAGSVEEACGYHNIPNVMKIGQGVYPARIFTDRPDWEYRPWTQWEGLDNTGFLKKMLRMVAAEGFVPLVRDASHMGFPSCWVIIPGMSEMYPMSFLKFRSVNSIFKNAGSIGRFPDYTEEEAKRFLSIIQFKENSYIENQTAAMVMLPLGGPLLTTDRIGAFLALRLGKYAEARHFFRKLYDLETDASGKTLLLCYMELCRQLSLGMERDAVYRLLHRLYREDIAARVEEETRDPETMLGKVFPRFQCFDCDSCCLAGRECKQPQEAEVFRKLHRVMAGSRVSQERMLTWLKELMN